MFTVQTLGASGFWIRSPGGKCVDVFRINIEVQGSRDKALAQANERAAQLNDPKRPIQLNRPAA